MKTHILIAMLAAASITLGDTNAAPFRSQVELIMGFNVSTGLTLRLLALDQRGVTYENEMRIIESPLIRSNAWHSLHWGYNESTSTTYTASRSRSYGGITICTESSVKGRASALASAIAEQYIKYRKLSPMISTNDEVLDIRILERPYE